MIPILLALDKIVLIEYVRDIAQWPVYLTIGNLSHEIQRSRIRPGEIMIGLILIHKRNSLEIKIKIYYRTMRVITKCKSKYHVLYKLISLNVTVLEKAVIEGLFLMYADGNV